MTNWWTFFKLPLSVKRFRQVAANIRMSSQEVLCQKKCLLSKILARESLANMVSAKELTWSQVLDVGANQDSAAGSVTSEV